MATPTREFRATLPASNGYQVDVLAYGRRVMIEARRGPLAATWYTKARITARRLYADLGSFGRIDLRVVRAGVARPQVLPRRCSGRITHQRSDYRGVFSLHGEGGFTSLDVSTLRARLVSHRARCNPAPLRDGVANNATQLEARDSADADDATQFTATHRDGADKVSFSAAAFDRVGSVTVGRYGSVSAPLSTVVFGRRRGRALVAPPAPFSGEARLESGPRRRSTWTGDLSVSLPGVGSIPLAGEPFRASLQRTQSIRRKPWRDRGTMR